MTTVRLIKSSANNIPLPDESVQTCATSPPYWGLRKYAGEQDVAWADGTTHPLGLEPTPELYVAHMVEVFREVKRVLRPDGTLWMNLGDSYAASGMGGNPAESEHRKQATNVGSLIPGRKPPSGLKPKDLVGIPWMVAFALRADGWYLRSDIIWHKPNPMPESVTDRPTKSHEYLFLLSKSERYFYDTDAIREPITDIASVMRHKDTGRGGQGYALASGKGERPQRNSNSGLGGDIEAGRNKRSVWTVATRPYGGAHFATYPPDLVEPCILAGSSPKACGVCGAPWARVTEREAHGGVIREVSGRDGLLRNDVGKHAGRIGEVRSTTTGWQPTCEHNDDSGHCTVLDPFNGSGTTGVVAVRHNRHYVGVDISDEYLALARERIDGIQRGFPWEAAS